MSAARSAAFVLPLLLCAGADPERLDPTRVHGFTLAPATFPESASTSRLPRAPAIAWSVRVPSGVAHAPTVAPDGAIVLAQTAPLVSQYDAAGRLQWTARLGPNPAATSPVLLADGRRLIVTEGAELFWISGRGAILRRSTLPLALVDRAPALAMAREGGVWLATGRRLLRIDASGEIAVESSSPFEARALLPFPDTLVHVAVQGDVSTVSRDGRLMSLSKLGVPIDAAARLGRSKSLLITEDNRVLELDHVTRALTVRFAEPNLDLQPSLAVNAAGDSRFIAAPDLLLAFAADGQERFRTTLGTAAAPTARRTSESLIDRDGNTLIVRSGADALVAHSDGVVARVEGTACAEPLRPSMLGSESAVLACRSGTLIRLDGARDLNDKAP